VLGAAGDLGEQLDGQDRGSGERDRAQPRPQPAGAVNVGEQGVETGRVACSSESNSRDHTH
jgi:hypothetical protein